MATAIMATAAAAAAVVATGTAQSAPAGQPAWIERPSARDVARFTPELAERLQISGGAVIRCAVNATGHMEQCQVVFEAPEQLGFGDAALRLSTFFRMNAYARTGSGGMGTVTIPINFVIEGPSSPKALLIARPLWTSAPSFAEVEEAYDHLAAGAAGTVSLRCRVDSRGRVALCNPTTAPAPDPAPPQSGGVADQPLLRTAQSLVARFQLAAPPGAERSQPVMVDLTFQFVDPKSEAFRDRRVGAPDWLTSIAPDAVIKLFPPEAAAKEIRTGRGVAECTVGPDGGLQACRPLAGEPDGMGFSEAAVKVASLMRMSLWTQAGGPVDGADVRIPVRFNLALTPTPALPAASPPGAAH